MKEQLPVYELFISDEKVEGLTAIGLVDSPAIQQDFFYFNKDKKSSNKFIMSTIDSEKQIIVGPALIPNKKILRYDTIGEPYYVNFSTDLVEKLAHSFLKESKQHLTTEQHLSPIKEVYMIESWIVKNEQDKIFTEYGYNFKDVHVGSWCIMYKVDNEDVINKIKSGEINGFSIEAYLSEKLTYSKSQNDQLLEEVEKQKDYIINLLSKYCKKTDNNI